MKDEKLPPKKSKSVKRKKADAIKPAVADPKESKDKLLGINPIEQAEIEKLIAHALMRHATEQLHDSKDKLKEVGHLSSIIDEYLSCFLLVGFSLQDEKVCIFNAKTSKDEAALVDYMRATFIEIFNNRP